MHLVGILKGATIAQIVDALFVRRNYTVSGDNIGQNKALRVLEPQHPSGIFENVNDNVIVNYLIKHILPSFISHFLRPIRCTQVARYSRYRTRDSKASGLGARFCGTDCKRHLPRLHPSESDNRRPFSSASC